METQHLTLRELDVRDAPLVYALTSRPEVARYMRFDQHTSLEQAVDLVRDWTAPPNLAWLITERATGALAGVFACKRERPADPDWGLSTFLAPELWNRGYSTEVLAFMLPELRARGARALTAYVVADNMGSRRVLEKNGFTEWEVLHFPDLPQGLYVYRREC